MTGDRSGQTPAAPRPAETASTPRDGAHPTQRDLVPYLLHRATNEVNRAWRDQLRPHGLTVQRWQVLSVLAAFDGIRITELADLVSVDQPVVSRVVDQMERDHLVVRAADPDDGRVTLVRLTEAGRRTHADLMPAATGFVDRLTDAMTAADVASLTSLLTAVLDGAAEATRHAETTDEEASRA